MVANGRNTVVQTFALPLSRRTRIGVVSTLFPSLAVTWHLIPNRRTAVTSLSRHVAFYYTSRAARRIAAHAS